MSDPLNSTNAISITTPGSGDNSFSVESDQSRTLPRQVSTGNLRGTQNITGGLTVSDPASNEQVISISGSEQDILVSNPAIQVPQIQIGKLADGSYGMKVSSPGTSVLNATDEQLIFNSNQDIFKIVKKVTTTCPAIGSSNAPAGEYKLFTDITPVAHGLDFIPAVVAFIVNAGQYFPTPLISNSAIGTAGAYWLTYQFSADGTNIYPETDLLIFNGTAAAPATNVVCYLLQETAN